MLDVGSSCIEHQDELGLLWRLEDGLRASPGEGQAHLCRIYKGDGLFNKIYTSMLPWVFYDVFKVSLSRAPPSGLRCPQDGGHVHYASDQISADVKRLQPAQTAMHRRAELCKAHKRKASIKIFARTRSRRVDIRSSGSNLARQLLPQTLVTPLHLVLQDRRNDIKCCLSNSAKASAKFGMVMSFSLCT